MVLVLAFFSGSKESKLEAKQGRKNHLFLPYPRPFHGSLTPLRVLSLQSIAFRMKVCKDGRQSSCGRRYPNAKEEENKKPVSQATQNRNAVRDLKKATWILSITLYRIRNSDSIVKRNTRRDFAQGFPSNMCKRAMRNGEGKKKEIR